MGILAAREDRLAGFDEKALARRWKSDLPLGRRGIAWVSRAVVVTVAIVPLVARHWDLGPA
jgi:hypothetical protein